MIIIILLDHLVEDADARWRDCCATCLQQRSALNAETWITERQQSERKTAERRVESSDAAHSDLYAATET